MHCKSVRLFVRGIYLSRYYRSIIYRRFLYLEIIDVVKSIREYTRISMPKIRYARQEWNEGDGTDMENLVDT